MRRTWTSKLKAGDQVPNFRVITHDDQVLTHKDLLGRKYILFFYNHDGSETCTKEACNMRDHFDSLTGLGYQILGVSEDSPGKHRKFISKHALPYSLISDKDNILAKSFDIYGKKEFMGRTSDAVHRTTFVIDEKGIIEAVIHPVYSSGHANQIIEAITNPS